MSQQKALEEYLLDLEDSLSPLTTMERAQAIQELHAEMVSEIERHGGDDAIRAVLKQLGPPGSQAKRYMIRKGLNYEVPKKRVSKFRVFALSMLGLFALSMVLFVFFVRSFLPLVEIDEKTGQVKLFGGAIVADGDSGNFSVSGNIVSYSSNDEESGDDDQVAGMFGGPSRTFFSTQPMTSLEGFRLNAKDGSFAIKTGDDGILSYRCRAAASTNINKVDRRIEGKELILDFTQLPKLKCKLTVPPEVHVTIEVENGKVTLDEVRQPSKVKLANGMLIFDPDSSEEYQLQANVQNGLVKGSNAEYLSSIEPGAHPIDLSVTNGTIVIR